MHSKDFRCAEKNRYRQTSPQPQAAGATDAVHTQLGFLASSGVVQNSRTASALLLLTYSSPHPGHTTFVFCSAMSLRKAANACPHLLQAMLIVLFAISNHAEDNLRVKMRRIAWSLTVLAILLRLFRRALARGRKIV